MIDAAAYFAAGLGVGGASAWLALAARINALSRRRSQSTETERHDLAV